MFDPGHYSFRAGYAGEDMPKTEIPSMVGITEEPSNGNGMEVTAQNGSEISSEMKAMIKKYTIGTTSIHVPKEGPLNIDKIHYIYRVGMKKSLI